MRRSDILLIYIHKMSASLRKGRPSAISENDISALVGIDIAVTQQLSAGALSMSTVSLDAEQVFLMGLAFAQQAYLQDQKEPAEKAILLLLAATESMPALEGPALVEILRGLIINKGAQMPNKMLG